MKRRSRFVGWALAFLLSYSTLLAPNAWAQNTPLTPGAPLAACSSFSDVVDTDYFCLALTVMVAAGDVGGYSDGTFRPNDDVTRGQFSKILVNHFDWNTITPSVATFTDVPVGSTFYTYIETAASRNIISGYWGDPNYWNTCMSPARFETSGLRYFRSCNNVTRGQMAKIVTGAAGFTDSVTGRAPSFYDVSSSHTFFEGIERLVIHASNAPFPPGVIPAPTCGSSTQPCFFPNKNAPRADVVSHVFNARNSNYYGQAFATKQGSYSGIEVYVTTPNPTVPNNRWIAVPVAATNRWNGKFIESGPTKDCVTLCDGYRHPYGSWSNWYGGGEEVYETLYLAAEGLYQYKSIHFGGTGGQWQSQFCSGNGCAGMITSDNIGSTLPFVAVGAESNYISQPVGYISVSSAYALANGYWNPWCYDPTLPPWKTAYPPSGYYGYISPCNNYSWAISY